MARLGDSDIRLLRGVVDDPPGSIRNLPTAVRTTTAERRGAAQIELRVRSGGPADTVATDIASEVLEPGWQEVSCRYPGERAFRGSIPTSP